MTATLLSGETFQYYRHFQVAAAGFTYCHKILGYLHDSEVAKVEDVDEMDEEYDIKLHTTNYPDKKVLLSEYSRIYFVNIGAK